MPPRRHEKNPIEPKHGLIRSIFLRLRLVDTSEHASILSLQAARISNNLYGNDLVSSFELAMGFTHPFTGDTVVKSVPPKIV